MFEYSIFLGALVAGCRTGSATPVDFAPTIFTTPNGTIRVHKNDFDPDVTCKWIISVATEKVLFKFENKR